MAADLNNRDELGKLLEEFLLEQMRSDPSAAMVKEVRSYLKDQGFIAARLPARGVESNLDKLMEAVEENAPKAPNVHPFPVKDEPAETDTA